MTLQEHSACKQIWRWAHK